jgi:hypothetical protein
VQHRQGRTCLLSCHKHECVSGFRWVIASTLFVLKQRWTPSEQLSSTSALVRLSTLWIAVQLAIDGGRFRTGDASLFAGGADMAAILAAATDVASAMAHLHSQVLSDSCPPVCACQKRL